MRRHDQFSLNRPWIAHPHAKELRAISEVLDARPAMAEAVARDLTRGLKDPENGARGMSGDQVLRVLILKQMKAFSYEELHFHLMDSGTYRTFCRFGVMEEVPGRSTLAENIKKVRAETLEEVNCSAMRRPQASRRGGRFASTRRWWRRTFITRPTPRCCTMGSR